MSLVFPPRLTLALYRYHHSYTHTRIHVHAHDVLIAHADWPDQTVLYLHMYLYLYPQELTLVIVLRSRFCSAYLIRHVGVVNDIVVILPRSALVVPVGHNTCALVCAVYGGGAHS